MSDFSIWIIGIAISVGLGVVAARYDTNTAKANGITVGLVGLTLTGITCLISEHINETRQFNDVVPTIQNDVWRQLVHSIADLDRESAENRFQNVLIEQVRQPVSNIIEEANDGRFVITSLPDASLIRDEVLGDARSEVIGASYVSPTEWMTSAGEDYEQALRAAALRGARCEIVYIVDSQNELGQLASVLRDLKRSRVLVKYVSASDSSVDQSDEDRTTFFVVDDQAVAAMSLTEARRFRLETFYVTKTRADDYRHAFLLLWHNAKDV
jgi:hypothetical protein